MARLWSRLAVLLVVASGLSCGDPEPRRLTLRRVSPPVSGACQPPVDARRFEVIALGDFPLLAQSADVSESLEIGTFPPDTREIELKVRGPGNLLLWEGRTGTLRLGDLADGSVVSLFAAPPRGFCPVAPLSRRRAHPLAVRAGRHVLVLGGTTSSDGLVPAGGAELYDPDQGQFEQLDASLVVADLRGAVGVALPDDRVFIVWENAFQIFDPQTRTFGPPTIPSGPGVSVKAHAQVAVLPDGRVAVTGGCASLGPERALPCPADGSAQLYDPRSNTWSSAPPLSRARAGGTALPDGRGRLWLVGGVDGAGASLAEAELWDPAGQPAVTVVAPAGPAAPLSAGGFFAGFAHGFAPADDAVALLPGFPGVGLARTAPAPRAGATVTALADGAVLVLGGAAPGSDEALLVHPHDGSFSAVSAAPSTPRRDHAAVRLDDGSVLVVGGRDAGGVPLSDAWIYRHDLTGPWSSVEAQVFVGEAPLMQPGDPGRARLEGAPARLVLSPSWDVGPASNWVRLAGPRYRTGELSAALSVAGGGGAGVLFGWEAPERYRLLRLFPGEPPSVVQIEDGETGETLCAGPSPTPALDRAEGAHDVGLSVADGETIVTIDGEPALVCPIEAARGAVGVALLGSAGELTLDALIVSRPAR